VRIRNELMLLIGLRVCGEQRGKEIHMARIIGKMAATCAVAGLFVLGGEVLSPGQPYGVYVGPSSAFAYAHYRRSGRLAQYDTSGARIDRGTVGWHGRRLNGAPSNPCPLAKAQQNRC
jgi:hypothetical protein